LRTSIDQALRLAGSRQFASVAQYEAFLFELLRKMTWADRQQHSLLHCRLNE
jgi:hypothetical protein